MKPGRARYRRVPVTGAPATGSVSLALPCLTSQAKPGQPARGAQSLTKERKGVSKRQQITPRPVCRCSPSGMRAFLPALAVAPSSSDGPGRPSDLAGARDRARRVAKTRYSAAADMHVRVVCARPAVVHGAALGLSSCPCPARPRASMRACVRACVSRSRPAPSQERRNEGVEYVRVPRRFGTVIAPARGGSARTLTAASAC